MGRQGEGSRVDAPPQMGLQGSWGFPWLSEHRPRRWRSLLALPDSLFTEDLRWLSTEPLGQGCALECLCLCQGGRCLTPTHVLLRQRTHHPSPAVYTILKAGSPAPDPWQMPSLGPRCSFLRVAPNWAPVPAGPSFHVPTLVPSWGCVVSRPHMLCSPRCQSTYNWGVQLPLKLEIQSSCGISRP